MNLEQFESRKRDHIRFALDSANQAQGLSGLEGVHLVHEALPELDFEEIQITAPCLGHRLRTPFYIAGMTAGHADAPALNEKLALACERRGWAMGVGSMRRDLETGGESKSLKGWRALRERAPNLVLFANLGISQIARYSVAEVRRLVEMIGGQGLVIHANALQECIQPEGTPRFRGATEALRRLCAELDVPVILKETGCGFSGSTLGRVAELGLSALDVSGLGGTHWGRIEGARAGESTRAGASQTFADWGVPTVRSVLDARRILPSGVEIWASGGVRSGLDSAKLIALGADRVGYAKPALEAALKGTDALDAWMEQQEFELKVALFCTGCASPEALRGKDGVWTAASAN